MYIVIVNYRRENPDLFIYASSIFSLDTGCWDYHAEGEQRILCFRIEKPSYTVPIFQVLNSESVSMT